MELSTKKNVEQLGRKGKNTHLWHGLKITFGEKKHRGWEEENVCFFFFVEKVLELPPQYQPVGGGFD